MEAKREEDEVGIMVEVDREEDEVEGDGCSGRRRCGWRRC